MRKSFQKKLCQAGGEKGEGKGEVNKNCRKKETEKGSMVGIALCSVYG